MFDVILGMDFLGPCFGYLEPLTENILWRVDCHDAKNMPTKSACLATKWRGNTRARENNYSVQLVTCGADSDDAMLGGEDAGEDLEDQVGMAHSTEVRTGVRTTTTPMHIPETPFFAMLLKS